MKKRWIKGIALCLSAMMTLGMAVGCGNSGSGTALTKDGNKTVFSYDGTDVPLKEAWIYAKMTATQYESTYSSYFGADFWSMDMGTDDEGNSTTFEEYVKDQVISQIKQVIVLDNHAKDASASLSDDEKKKCEEYAKAFAEDESGKAILKECGATEEDMVKIYEDNELASKVKDYVIKDTDTNVTDDEARKSTIYRIVFPTTNTDDDGNSTNMSDEEKAAQLKKAQAALAEIQGGKSIEDVAKAQEYTDTDETFAKGESAEGDKFEELLTKMKDGDVTSEVQECTNGYVIAKLVAYTDASATEENKTTIVSQRQQEIFNAKYEEWTKELEEAWTAESVDQELWAQVVLHSEDSTATESQAETTGAEATTAATGTTAAGEGAEAATGTTAAADTTAASEATTAAK